MNKYSIAFSTCPSTSKKYDHVFNIKTMSVEDERLERLRFRTINTRHGEYSLTFPLRHNNRNILDLRHLGSLSYSVDWSRLDGKRHHVFGFLRNGNWLSGGENGTLCLYNIEGEKLASLVGHKGTLTTLAYYDNWVVSGDSDGLIILWNMNDAKIGKRKLQPYLLMTYSMDNEWVVWSSEGYFSASAEGDKLLSLVPQFRKMVPQKNPELLAKKIVKPKLFYKIVAQEKATGRIDILPPTVRFVDSPQTSDKRDVKVLMEICDNGGGVETATLYLRGTSVTLQESARGITVKGKVTDSLCFQYERDISLLEGDNKIVLLASDVTGEESRPAIASIHYLKEKRNQQKLHIVTIAVSKYANRHEQLLYPVADAKAITNVFEKIGLGVFSSVETHSLLDEAATKAGLFALFSKLQESVGKDDVFILFLAGHGIYSEHDAQYHFLPYNTDTSSEKNIVTTSIGVQEFDDLLSQIYAVQSLILIDTCESGGFEGFSDQKEIVMAAHVKAVQRLGRALLMASSKNQVAYEGYKGHGVFTHFVLEGAQGKADYTNDGYISVDELSTFVNTNLADLTERKWGYRQETVRSMRGLNFKIGKY